MDKADLNLGETNLWEQHLTSLQDSRSVGSHPRAPRQVPGALSSEFSPPLKLAILLPAGWTKDCLRKCLHQGHPW